MYFQHVEEIKDVADALFLLITQISLIYRVEIFCRNQARIKKVVQRLQSDLFCPNNFAEDQWVFFELLKIVEYLNFIFFQSR